MILGASFRQRSVVQSHNLDSLVSKVLRRGTEVISGLSVDRVMRHTFSERYARQSD